MLRRIADYCRNPQDLISRDDLNGFMQSELGIPYPNSELIVQWLLDQQYLSAHNMTYYDAGADLMIEGVFLRHGPKLETMQRA